MSNCDLMSRILCNKSSERDLRKNAKLCQDFFLSLDIAAHGTKNIDMILPFSNYFKKL